MKNEILIHSSDDIKSKIYTFRGVQVMLDSDLAEIYGYATKRFNEQVKNNIERFDEDFRFQLTDEEVKELSRWKFSTLKDEDLRGKNSTSSSRSNFSTLNNQPDGRGHNIKYNPYAFTEQGIYMLMTVLKGELAVAQSKMLIRMFKEMKQFLVSNASVFAEIYTAPKTKITAQDVQKFNSQYPTLTLNHTTKMHDRFLIIDQKILYHVGASLKDLGKKCFAFEVLDASLIRPILQNV